MKNKIKISLILLLSFLNATDAINTQTQLKDFSKDPSYKDNPNAQKLGDFEKYLFPVLGKVSPEPVSYNGGGSPSATTNGIGGAMSHMSYNGFDSSLIGMVFSQPITDELLKTKFNFHKNVMTVPVSALAEGSGKPPLVVYSKPNNMVQGIDKLYCDQRLELFTVVEYQKQQNKGMLYAIKSLKRSGSGVDINEQLRNFLKGVSGGNPEGFDEATQRAIQQAGKEIVQKDGTTVSYNYGNKSLQYDEETNDWSGSTDCSGLTKTVLLKEAGIEIPDGASAQLNCAQPVPCDQMQPGDLMFFNNGSFPDKSATHVGLYVGDENGQMKMLEAANSKIGTRISSPANRSDFVGCGRYPSPYFQDGKQISCPNKPKGIHGTTLDKLKDLDGIVGVPGVNTSFDIYCAAPKGTLVELFDFDTASQCKTIKDLNTNNGSDEQLNITSDLMENGKLTDSFVYMGTNPEEKKHVCVIKHKKAVIPSASFTQQSSQSIINGSGSVQPTPFNSTCIPTEDDLKIIPQGVESWRDAENRKIKELREKFTTKKCCGQYPGSTIFIEGAVDSMNENSYKNVSQIQIKCMPAQSENLSQFNSVSYLPETPTDEYMNVFDMSCGSIVYTGIFEQNIIDGLNNFSKAVEDATSVYAKCCDGDMSELRKYAYMYATAMCSQEVMEMFTTGTFDGIKINDSLTEMASVCSNKLKDVEVKGGSMTNSALFNAGGRIVSGLAMPTNYLGCIGERIADSKIINKIAECIDSNYKDFMKFIEWLAAQQLTFEIGLQHFQNQICDDQLRKGRTVDLELDFSGLTGSLNRTLTGMGNLTMEPGKNYYGVIKTGDGYAPALTLQHRGAFLETNFNTPHKGLKSSEVPTSLFHNLYQRLNLEVNTHFYENGQTALYTETCKRKSFDKITNTIIAKLNQVNEVKSIDAYIYLYLNNTSKTMNGYYRGLDLLDSSCSRAEGMAILKELNVALRDYIIEYLLNTKKTFLEAEEQITKLSLQTTQKQFGLKTQNQTIEEQIMNKKASFIYTEIEMTKKCENFINNIDKQTCYNQLDLLKKTNQQSIQSYKDSLTKNQQAMNANEIEVAKELESKMRERLLQEKDQTKDGDHPTLLMKKTLEIYQAMKINKEKQDFKNAYELKKATSGVY